MSRIKVSGPKPTIKERLANKIEESFKEYNAFVDPRDLHVNRGATKYNDWCSWTGIVYNIPGVTSISSYTTMTELVKKKEPLVFIDKLTGELA